MNPVLEILAGEITNPKVRFVFPSETASSLWARKVCLFTGTRSVALDRFLAWDRFKEKVVRAEVRGRRPVSGVIRRLFAEALIKKNAASVKAGGGLTGGTGETGFPFHSLIPPAFAEEGAVFAVSLAALLPSLALWESKRAQAAIYRNDDEDRDMELIKREYAAFLDRYGLFEPSWEKPPLRDREYSYIIFFPEIIDDFDEYEALLTVPPVRLIYAGEKAFCPAAGDGASADTGPAQPDSGGALRLYNSAREEIRSAVLEIRRLHEEGGIPYEDMAISVPGLEDIEPYLLRELSLYNIPFHRHSGQPLGEYGAGRLFPLIGGCTANNFSFSSLKALILNDRLPWRYPELNRALIEFGIKNNCVSGYAEKGRFVDVWTGAFRASRERNLGRYYEELKSALRSVAGSSSFAEIRRRYFAFRGRIWKIREEPAVEIRRQGNPGRGVGRSAGENTGDFISREDWSRGEGFFSRDRISDEGDAVLARCIEELSALIQLEEEYPELIPVSPFAFYLSILQSQQYVPQRSEAGVNIFRYRVAAAAPFSCHFLLNASQDAATVLYQPLRFLRQDKRSRLGLTDTDASASFFRLYRPRGWGSFKPYTRISASRENFSGWAIPHSYFAGSILEAPPPPDDPFTEERSWWAGLHSASSMTSSSMTAPITNEAGTGGTAVGGNIFPSKLFPVQQEGFKRWRAALEGSFSPGRFNLLRTSFPGPGFCHQMLRKRIAARQYDEPGRLMKVSATADLNPFFTCPALWFYQKILGLKPFFLEAQLLDDASLGLLYHEILRNLFGEIREQDGSFQSAHIDRYRSWLVRITALAARQYQAFQGPLAVPLLVSQSAAIVKRLSVLLKTEAKYFDGYIVGALEQRLCLEQEGMLLNGIIDRVSVSPGDEVVIIDYKTGGSHSKKASTGTEDDDLRDFQIPLYIKLYEEETGQRTAAACFMIINKHDISVMVGSPGRKRGHSRDEYQKTLDILEKKLGQFRQSVEELDFAPRTFSLKDCLGCDYRTLCRTSFFLNAPAQEAAHVR
ncbi:MAG: PD-(D/E)XK nuclease family protein [Treponema sp.]|jgi:RecB family exonuclease|nr:PD-(D/E)XK nuclease family protein [Treponema sp.]